MDTFVLLILLVGLLASQTAQSQDVSTRDLRSPSQAASNRIIHFGKRVANSEPPPAVASQETFDSYRKTAPQQLQQEQQPHIQPDGYPYLLTIELESGKTLQPVFEEPTRDMVFAFERPQLEFAIKAAEQRHRKESLAHKAQTQANMLANEQLLRLIGADQSVDANDESGKAENSLGTDAAGKLLNATSNERDTTGHQQQVQQATIRVSTRTMQAGSGSVVNLPKAYISNLLFGRPGSPAGPGFGANYYKKAEPKENRFMHFGRK